MSVRIRPGAPKDINIRTTKEDHMLFNSFLVLIGILIGWNLPQPEYAKNIQAKVVAWFKKKLKR